MRLNAFATIAALLCSLLPARLAAGIHEEPWVRVQLFSERPLTALWVDAPGGVRLLGQTLPSRLRLSVDGRMIRVTGRDTIERRVPRLRLSPARNVDLTLKAAGLERTVSGFLDVRVHRGRLDIINAMPAETYVLGIVEPELGSVDHPLESLKAQIVASRSYLLSMLGRHRREGFDFCDGPHCQAFRGTGGIKSRVLEAGADVRGLYLSYAGRPIPAFYHDSCGGATAAANEVWPVSPVPYLRSVQDGASEPYCRFAPKAHWRFVVSRADLKRCLVKGGLLDDAGALRALQVTHLDASGRVQSIAIRASDEHRVSARRMCWAINRYFGGEALPSTLFRIVRRGPRFEFDGRGWGHGVGLCQWGAIEMAREGRSFQEILAHYFPGTTLERIPTPVYASNRGAGA